MEPGAAPKSGDAADSAVHRGPATTPRERLLFDLARRDKSNVQETFRAITEASAVFLDVSRVSIWELIDEPGDERIVCKDLYLLDERKHALHDPLHARDFPTYFRAIRERRIITADRAECDPRTAEYQESYLRPLGITSMMDVPIWHAGRVYGVLCHEHRGPFRGWTSEAESFAVHMADIASLSLEAGDHSAAERRLEAVLDSVDEAVVVMDTQGRIVRANPVGRREFIDRGGGGLTLAERELLFQYLDAEDRPIPRERFPLYRVLAGETVRNEVMGIVFRRTGERWYCRLSGYPIHEGDALKYIVFVVSDISDEIYFERLKRDFIATLAHELKTPVAIVKGYAQHLEYGGRLPPESGPMLDAIGRASSRMERLIDALLDVTNVTLGRVALTKERVELVDLTRSIVERTARQTSSHKFTFRAPSHVALLADRARIEQAVRRLVENAVRYSPNGGGIEVDIVSAMADVVLSVHDHGIGIPIAEQQRIFEMFYKATTGVPYAEGGLGIGLVLAREITRRHGGDIWFESEEGSGTTFRLRLPLAEAA